MFFEIGRSGDRQATGLQQLTNLNALTKLVSSVAGQYRELLDGRSVFLRLANRALKPLYRDKATAIKPNRQA